MRSRRSFVSREERHEARQACGNILLVSSTPASPACVADEMGDFDHGWRVVRSFGQIVKVAVNIGPAGFWHISEVFESLE